MAPPPPRTPLSVRYGYSPSHVRALYHAARAHARKMYGERRIGVKVYQVVKLGGSRRRKFGKKVHSGVSTPCKVACNPLPLLHGV